MDINGNPEFGVYVTQYALCNNYLTHIYHMFTIAQLVERKSFKLWMVGLIATLKYISPLFPYLE